MRLSSEAIADYLRCCEDERRLDRKTVRAHGRDLQQAIELMGDGVELSKDAKERVVQLESAAAIRVLRGYLPQRDALCAEVRMATDALFVSKSGHRLSERSVRDMVAACAEVAGLPVRVTPHMFRYTFATLLLDEGVDIRVIQSLLGHSSIKTTEIYTHVSSATQREALRLHNPRNAINGGR